MRLRHDPAGRARCANSSTYGVIKFTLHATSYDWQFIPISGQTFTDSGTASTHGAPGGGGGSEPVGDWRMNEGSGTTLVDSSVSANNGTILGNPTWVTGQHGQAIRFDGTGDYATVPDNATLDISSSITLATWVRPEKTGTQYLIKKATQGGTDGYEPRWRRRASRSSASTRPRAALPTGWTHRLPIPTTARPGCIWPPPPTAQLFACT